MKEVSKQIYVNLEEKGMIRRAKEEAEKMKKIKAEERMVEFEHKRIKLYDDPAFLINPNIDCSDKELHHKNGYKSAGKNLHSFIKNGDQAVFVRDVFRPKDFGKLTKDSVGSTKIIMNRVHKPDFRFGNEKLKEILDKTKKDNAVSHQTYIKNMTQIGAIKPVE